MPGAALGDAVLFQPVFEVTNASAKAAVNGTDLVAQRIKGYVLSAVSLEQMMRSGSENLTPPPFAIRLSQMQGGSEKKILYADNFADPSVNTSRFIQRTSFGVLGQRWLLEAEPSAAYVKANSAGWPLAFAAMVGALTLLLTSVPFALRLYWSKVRAARFAASEQIEKALAEKTTLMALFRADQEEALQITAEQKKDELEAAYKQVQESELYAMQSEKMSSIGQMVAGVAHEINTPLGFVSSNVEMIGDLINRLVLTLANQEHLMAQAADWSRMDIASQQAWIEAVKAGVHDIRELRASGIIEDAPSLAIESLSGLERISEIVGSLKDFSRVDRAQSDDVDLHQCIDSTLVIAHNVLKGKAHIVKKFALLPTIACSPSQINQVILNILINAAQAMDYMGTITLVTYVDGEFVGLDISDTGPGMSDEISRKIFEPFFTTKGAGEGTGLGLAICQKIILLHNGTLTVQSAPNAGTTFTVRLPIAGVAGPANLAQINALSEHYLKPQSTL